MFISVEGSYLTYRSTNIQTLRIEIDNDKIIRIFKPSTGIIKTKDDLLQHISIVCGEVFLENDQED